MTDKEFSQELDAHIEMATADNIRRGMSPEEARRQAMIRLGGRTSLEQRHREARGILFLEELLQDLRFAFRLIARDRWFSAAAMLAIALGIGANTLGFTLINASFIRGFPFPEAERLFTLSWRPESGRRTTVSVPDYLDWQKQTKTFSGIAAWSVESVNISDDTAPPEQLRGASVTTNHFDVLRQPPLLGRVFQPGEDQRSADPVVIIGYNIFKNRYNLDPSAIGKTLRINGNAATIIGVMPAGMEFPENEGSQLWVPLIPIDQYLLRSSRPLRLFGRLADGVNRREAEAEMEAIARQTIAAYPEESKNVRGIVMETFTERFLGGAARPMMFTVMGAVMFVLLIACANVANLLLSRSIYRAREVAVRFSMGATRWRIVRQLLVESILLSSLGGVAGLALGAYAVSAFDTAIRKTGAPYWLFFTIDYTVLAYVAAICVATGILFGLAPALHVSKDNNHEVLKDGGRGTAGTRRARSFSSAMVVAELALTAVLLCGAGLMFRSFMALYAIDPGIEVDRLMRMRIQLPVTNYPTDDAKRAFFEQLEPRLTSIAGVSGAAITTGVPPLDGGERVIQIEGEPAPEPGARRRYVSVVVITPTYFDVVGVPPVRGRVFDANDGAPGSETVIVNQDFITRFFPGQDVIGKRIKLVPFDDEVNPQSHAWRTIVGVSGRILHGNSQDSFQSEAVYIPFRQEAPRAASLLLRTSRTPATVMADVRRQVQAVDRDQPIFSMQTVRQLFEEERSVYSIFATLFAILATIALTLSAVGIYAVMSYAVTQRTQEIGVRMAVGAQPGQVSWIFLARGLKQLLIGLGIGLPAALGLASVARFRLVEVEPSDPVTMIGIAVMLTLITLAACLIPVMRAAKVDPVVALRSE